MHKAVRSCDIALLTDCRAMEKRDALRVVEVGSSLDKVLEKILETTVLIACYRILQGHLAELSWSGARSDILTVRSTQEAQERNANEWHCTPGIQVTRVTLVPRQGVVSKNRQNGANDSQAGYCGGENVVRT
jgi:hypothetical protein